MRCKHTFLVMKNVVKTIKLHVYCCRSFRQVPQICISNRDRRCDLILPAEHQPHRMKTQTLAPYYCSQSKLNTSKLAISWRNNVCLSSEFLAHVARAILVHTVNKRQVLTQLFAPHMTRRSYGSVLYFNTLIEWIWTITIWYTLEVCGAMKLVNTLLEIHSTYIFIYICNAHEGSSAKATIASHRLIKRSRNHDDRIAGFLASGLFIELRQVALARWELSCNYSYSKWCCWRALNVRFE